MAQKTRIYELAKDLDRNNKDLIEVLDKWGFTGKTHSSGIEDDLVLRLRRHFSDLPPRKQKAPKIEPTPVEEEAPAPKPEPKVEAKPEIKPEPKPAAPAATPAQPVKPAQAAPSQTARPAQQQPAQPAQTAQPRPQQQQARPQQQQRPQQPHQGQRPDHQRRDQQQRPQRGPEPPKAPEEPRFVQLPPKKKPMPPRPQQQQKPQQQFLKKPAKRPTDAPTMADLVPQEDLEELKVPDRYRKTFEAEKVEKFKVKPGMQKAFQAIRKIDSNKHQGPHQPAAQTPGGPMQQKRRDFRGGPHHDPRMEKMQQATTAPRKKTLKITEGMTVKEFAELISVKASDIIKKFMSMGYMPTINQPVDPDAALIVAEAMGIKLELAAPEEIHDMDTSEDNAETMKPRPPIVTIMGHVDHGKTSLLDAIRETRVMDQEAGGITQHIGAYKVAHKDREIVFLDTPGHEAFTTLRARGASVTDIVILVVAADDGVKPQTIEAIDHAKAAGVPIIVAINKIDKPGADPQRVRTELTEHEIVSEEWGGQNIFAEISAKKRIGIENILELILLQADMLELKANPDRHATGVVIESRLDKGRGPVATLLVQAGTLKIGDVFVSGVNFGKVKALYDDLGKRLNEASVSTPVELIGFGSVPNAGDTFAVVEDEKTARQIAMARLSRQKASVVVQKRKLTLDELFNRIKEGEVRDLNIIIKADVQGSVEALKDAMEQITHAEVKVRVIHSAIGGINESDVMLAAASNAVIIGFNVRPESKAASIAEREGVDIELYTVIYEAIDDVKKALEGMLKPTIKEKVLGRAEVRSLFVVSRLGTIAGCMVVDGSVQRACEGVRVIRDNIVVYQGRLGSLKRFKDDAKEVQQGYECGIMVENFNDLKVGDIIENFIIEKIAAKL